jgi:hypothetical protein
MILYIKYLIVLLRDLCGSQYNLDLITDYWQGISNLDVVEKLSVCSVIGV